MKDDIAKNPENPTPGIILNHPNGTDVYKGVPHDYTGKAVTPDNFMAVLRGDKEALAGVGSGKVLESGPQDSVFIYIADHGAPGYIDFPSVVLTAIELNTTVHYMYNNKKYENMVIYMESCEAGSMFQNILPNNINVYATTASNAVEDSYACYFDIGRGVYLGDLYSVNWMEHSDKEILTKKTLQTQYEFVKEETTNSHVQEFGDLKIAKLPLSEFQGREEAEPIVYPNVEKKNSVRSRDVPFEMVKRKYMMTHSKDEKAKLLKEIKKMHRNRQFMVGKVSEILTEIFHNQKIESKILEKHLPLKNYQCYDKIRLF